jgi:hypothetical protein
MLLFTGGCTLVWLLGSPSSLPLLIPGMMIAAANFAVVRTLVRSTTTSKDFSPFYLLGSVEMVVAGALLYFSSIDDVFDLLPALLLALKALLTILLAWRMGRAEAGR